MSKGLYINGQWQQGTGSVLQSINPADTSLLWEGVCASQTDADRSYKSAENALKDWAYASFDERARYVQAFAGVLTQRKEGLAALIAQEMGKPLWEARTEVTAVINKVAISIQAYQERTWPKINQGTCLRFKPQGVALVLGAFNFPAHLSHGHIIPALLAGNTVLYKPSELTPAVAEYLMQCWHETGLPAGVLNCLQGGPAVAGMLMAQGIQALYFTGSYRAGKQIHQYFSGRPEIILALEMGGNNPLILDKVSDVKAALYQTLLSTLITSGQRCTCARRVLIPNTSQGDDFLDGLLRAYQSVRIGAWNADPEPFMGPVVGHAQALQHLQAQAQLVKLGGKALLPMRLLQDNTGFLSAGLLDMTAVNNAPDEEIFAPLTQIYRYSKFEEALDLANKTRYGLACALLSDNESRYKQFYQSMHAGLINWNRQTTGASSSLPFGGTGISGNHRPSAYFAADYCAYPVASMEQARLSMTEEVLPGIILE